MSLCQISQYQQHCVSHAMARDFSRIKSLTFPLCYLPLAMPHCHTGVWYFALAAVAPDKSFKFDRGAIVLCCFISENAVIFFDCIVDWGRRRGEGGRGVFASSPLWAVFIIQGRTQLSLSSTERHLQSPTAAKILSLYIIFDHQKVTRKVRLTILYDVCVLLVLGQCVSGQALKFVKFFRSRYSSAQIDMWMTLSEIKTLRP